MVVCFTLSQPPDVFFCSNTVTFDTHPANPPALTDPCATRCLLSFSVTVLECTVLTTKLALLVAVPLGVVTAIFPVVAVAGTDAVICVAEFTVNVAVTLLNFTAVVVNPVPLKFVPVIVTTVPVGPDVGVNEVMVGGGATVKLVALVAVPLVVVTRIGPVVAVVGTVAVMDVGEVAVNAAVTLLKLTESTLTKFVPVIVTDVPTAPEVGVNDVIVGAGAPAAPTVKDGPAALVATGVVTKTGPVVAVSGTKAETCDVEAEDEGTTWKVAATPLKLTAVAFRRFVPKMLTAPPGGPDVGENEVTVGAQAGAAAGVNVCALGFEVPSTFCTVIVPAFAPPGTVTLICVAETTSPATRFASAPVK